MKFKSEPNTHHLTTVESRVYVCHNKLHVKSQKLFLNKSDGWRCSVDISIVIICVSGIHIGILILLLDFVCFCWFFFLSQEKKKFSFSVLKIVKICIFSAIFWFVNNKICFCLCSNNNSSLCYPFGSKAFLLLRNTEIVRSQMQENFFYLNVTYKQVKNGVNSYNEFKFVFV